MVVVFAQFRPFGQLLCTERASLIHGKLQLPIAMCDGHRRGFRPDKSQASLPPWPFAVSAAHRSAAVLSRTVGREPTWALHPIRIARLHRQGHLVAQDSSGAGPRRPWLEGRPPDACAATATSHPICCPSGAKAPVPHSPAARLPHHGRPEPWRRVRLGMRGSTAPELRRKRESESSRTRGASAKRDTSGAPHPDEALRGAPVVRGSGTMSLLLRLRAIYPELRWYHRRWGLSGFPCIGSLVAVRVGFF